MRSGFTEATCKYPLPLWLCGLLYFGFGIHVFEYGCWVIVIWWIIRFHQCSSRQLKAAFSNSSEDIMALNYDLEGPSSPKLPSSVSKSRGKDFVNKKWIGDNQDFSLHKRNPEKVLSGTSSCGNSGSSDEMKPKSSFIHLKGTSSSKSSSVCKSSFFGNPIPNCSKPISSCEDPTCTLSSMTNRADESSTTSTITSESDQQKQQKFMEKSNQALSQANGLLSVIKARLRKSGVTRPASRVEINGDRRQSRGRKSSSSKSSVGSSSNPCNDGRTSTSTSMQYKERTPDSRHVARMTHASSNRIKSSKVSKTTHKIDRGTTKYRMAPNVAKPVHLEAAKPKVWDVLIWNTDSEDFRVFLSWKILSHGSLRDDVQISEIGSHLCKRLV